MMRPTLTMPETFDDCLTYAKQLRKLYEEYLEVLTSTGKNRIEELADMLEVMISLAKLENKSLDDIITVAKKKNEKSNTDIINNIKLFKCLICTEKQTIDLQKSITWNNMDSKGWRKSVSNIF